MTNDNDPAVLSLYDTQTQLAGMLGRVSDDDDAPMPYILELNPILLG